MTYLAGPEIGGAAALARTAAAQRRVRAAVATSQTFLVIRILSVLLLVSFLPSRLPTLTLRLVAGSVATVPLDGVSSGAALMVIAAISAVELYLVYRLADGARAARHAVLAIESVAILATSSALAVGATVAALPLVTSVGATGLLLLNQVRWSFRLSPADRGALTGRRRGGVFAGYAGSPLDTPKRPQSVEYTAGRRLGD